MYLWCSLCTLYLHACQVRVTVGDWGLCCYSCYVFWTLINSLVCWFYTEQGCGPPFIPLPSRGLMNLVQSQDLERWGMEEMLDRRRMACSLMPGEAQCTSLYKWSIPPAFSKMFPEKSSIAITRCHDRGQFDVGGLCGQLDSNTQKVKKNGVF